MAKQKKKKTRNEKIRLNVWQKFLSFSLLNKCLAIVIMLLVVAFIVISGFFIYTKVTAPPKNVTASDMSPIIPPTGYKAIMFKNSSFPLPLAAKEKRKELWRIEEKDVDFLVDRIYFTEDNFTNNPNEIMSYLNNCGYLGISEVEVGTYKSGNKARFFASKEDALKDIKMHIVMESDVSKTDLSEESATYESLYNFINESEYPLYCQFMIATHDNSKTWDIFMISTHTEESKDIIKEYAETLLFQYVTGQY